MVKRPPKKQKGNRMKSEIRTAAQSSVISALRAALGEKIVPVRVAKKDGFAFDTGVKDENGKPIYAVIEATIKNTEDTKTAKAFDLAEAVQARVDSENAPKKERKTKESAPNPEVEAKRAAHKERERITEEWCMEHLTSEGMTATEIKAAIPELADVTVMQVGTYLKNIAAHNTNVERNVVKGKPTYCLA